MNSGHFFDSFITKFKRAFLLLPFIPKTSGKDDILFQKELTYVNGSKKIYVLITHWYSSVKDYSKVEKFITSLNDSFIVYRFPPNLLSSNYELTRKNFLKLKNDINLDLKNLEKEYGFTAIKIIGISLGGIPTFMVANSNETITDVELIVPGNDLAESLWFGMGTQHLRKEFEKQGITLEKLKEFWKELSPENNLVNLKNKKVTVFLSEADAVIPYACGVKLIEAMRKNELGFELETNKNSGHYLTVLDFLRHPEKFIRY